MVTHTQKLKRQRSVALLPAITLLAKNLCKQTWGILLITFCGIVACVGLVCAVPLFMQTAIQTGLQGVIQQEPGGTAIINYVSTDQPTPAFIQKIGGRVDQVFQAHLSNYLAGGAQLSLSTPKLQVLDSRSGKAVSQLSVSVFGYDPAPLAQRVTLVKGRLPQAHTAAKALEVALTQPVADNLGWQIGSWQQVRFPVAASSTVWRLHVVGIVAPGSATSDIWHISNPSGDNYAGMNGGTDNILASLPALLSNSAALQITSGISGIGSNVAPLAQTTTTPITTRPLQYTIPHSGGPGTDPSAIFMVYWSYPISLSHIDGNNLNTFIHPYGTLVSDLYDSVQDAHIISHNTISPVETQLESYQHEMPYEMVAVILLLVSLLVLALFMVSMLANVLVEGQLATIVMLRSRGATQRHIFGAFTLQGILLSITALVLGPICAIFLVGVIGQLLLPATASSTFGALIGNLPHTFGQIWFIALITVVVALFVMIMALRRASLIDIVELRRNASRPNRTPLWKRLYLDFFLLLVIVAGIAYYQLLAKSGIGDPILLAPLAFLAAPLTLLAVSLFFLRIYPFLTRLGTRSLAKSKAAPGVLAFSQMERQPHATLRMILLLALALASSTYLLSFIATQQYRIEEIADYQIGADFSGKLAGINARQSFKDLQHQYSSVAGVASATLGYHDIANSTVTQTYVPPVVVSAIDASTYAQTAVWQSFYAKQTLPSLTNQLIDHRASAIANDEIPVIADTQLWDRLNLYPGMHFTLTTDNAQFQNLHFVALAEVDYLPRVQDDMADSEVANMMMDYQNYSAVYAKDHHGAQIQPNYLWLSTHGDVHSISQVRQAFPTLKDRRASIAQAENEPLQVALKGILILGIIIALVLALIGVGLAAWLSVKQRRMSFSILRALGMAPGQIAKILLWEQGFTYLFALLLGLGVGWLVTLVVAPAFGLLDHILQVVGIVFNNTNLPLQKSAPIPTTWFGLMIAIFVLICGIVLLLMSGYGARPAVGQTLRLNED
ncbi:FtsX-like permease family protein [Dictyobacter arantiisoli]|uniref:ABC3 transporter permease C-terminal domain-containing protein n=1 Tax=Dictyobacter arantiisoli TaxID=2014874 RepID=A0A5A5T7L9_9CHLR|nr:FtsX-like permease family protein [Dictyobacter arantiisoli]GCF07003.1 hypothetical protein KDI_05670 [Dictyobacter arantiisoli]